MTITNGSHNIDVNLSWKLLEKNATKWFWQTVINALECRVHELNQISYSIRGGQPYFVIYKCK